MARLYNRICRVEQYTGNFRESLESCREAGSIQKELLERRPSDIDLRGDLASTYQNMAGAYFSLGDWPRTEVQRRHALTEFQELYRLQPDNEELPLRAGQWVSQHGESQEQTKHYAEAKANACKPSGCSTCTSERHPKDYRSARTGPSPSSAWEASYWHGRSARRARRLPGGAAYPRTTAALDPQDARAR